MIQLKTKLAFVKEIVIHEYSYKRLYIIRSSTMDIRKNWKNKNCSVVSNVFFLKIKITLENLHFSGKVASSSDALKILKRMTFIES